MIDTIKNAMSKRFKFIKNEDGSHSFTVQQIKEKKCLFIYDSNDYPVLEYKTLGHYHTELTQNIFVFVNFNSMFLLKIEEKQNDAWRETHLAQGCGSFELTYQAKSNEQRISILPMHSNETRLPIKVAVWGVV